MKIQNFRNLIFPVVVLASILILSSVVIAQQTISGIVFHDKNENVQFDHGEPGLEEILVSNGSDIVASDEYEHYEINTKDNSIIFVIKPRSWTSKIDHKKTSVFYQLVLKELVEPIFRIEIQGTIRVRIGELLTISSG